jgi:hypothetical protein
MWSTVAVPTMMMVTATMRTTVGKLVWSMV